MNALLMHFPLLMVQGPAVVLAIALAAAAAVSFAVAAVLQHRAVDQTVNGSERPGMSDRLALSGLAQLITQRGWLIGLVMSGLGCSLHVVALVLAPVSLIQPIGVLAVPLAVLFASRRSTHKPAAGMILGVVVSVAGVGALVVFTAGKVVSGPVSAPGLVIACVLAGTAVAILIALSALRSGTGFGAGLPAVPRWLRCVSRAIAGAICFGLGSALLRVLAQRAESTSASLALGRLASPGSLLIIAGVVLALVLGGWLVQQAYASGPPEVVVACLTVVDPLVAVLFGLSVLSEGTDLDPTTVVAMIISALIAIVGVATLVRHHPDAGRVHRENGGAPRPSSALTADHLV